MLIFEALNFDMREIVSVGALMAAWRSIHCALTGSKSSEFGYNIANASLNLMVS